MTDDELREYLRDEIAHEEAPTLRNSYRLDALRAILRILESLPEPNLWARAMGAK